MDNHKILYKSSRSNVPRQYGRENRELLAAKRTKNRTDRFQYSRNISPSPTPQNVPNVIKKEIIIPLNVDGKENDDVTNRDEDANTTRLVKIICEGTSAAKISKKEAFIKRFFEWKQKKQIEKKKEMLNKKKPFVSAVNNCRQTTSIPLVPKGHHEGFLPPVGLRNPTTNDKVNENESAVSKGRLSVYTVLPTPPRRRCGAKIETANSLMEKSKLSTTALKTDMKPRPLMNNSSGVARKIRTVTQKRTQVSQKSSGDLEKTEKPKMLPPQLPTRPPTSIPNRTLGAAGKIRTVTQKRTEVSKETKKRNLKADCANLRTNLKVGKPLSKKKLDMPVPKISVKKIDLLKNNETDQSMIIQTPRNFDSLNHFDEFVTSTTIKDSLQMIENVKGISPIRNSHKTSVSNFSAKRKILTEKPNAVQEHGSTQNANKSKDDDLQNTTKKYNFIRYSGAAAVTVNDRNNLEIPLERSPLSDAENRQSVVTSDINDKTPTKFGPEERPANYLSPFVSVSRGKVSLKKEKEKRNSVYVQNAPGSSDLHGESTSQNMPSKYSVEVQRTLEAVRYFRKQLNDEIERLHQLCDVWELYKTENIEKIQNANGEDMINVTIGQTRLLTSKKFMQFKGLIDRCESGATGIGATEYDGSENTKPITSVDLEGFWSMLGLQVDNLDKRFDNLNRWKANDWNDPDEKPKIKNNLTKVKKAKLITTAKAKPSSALQQMLRKMQAEMRKNKNKTDDNDIIVLTSSKVKQRSSTNSKNTTPRKSVDTSDSPRLSIVVKDRKYYSPAPTILSVSSQNHKTVLIPPKPSQDSPKLLKVISKLKGDCFRPSLGCLKNSDLVNENSSLYKQSPIDNGCKKSMSKPFVNCEEKVIFTEENVLSASGIKDCLSAQTPHYSPVPTGRKSILKTPGTAKSRLRNVIFNERLRVKKFNFLVNEDGDTFNAENGDADHSHEEDLAKGSEDDQGRILTLRNRKVNLRPSCEIVIPKK